MTLVLSFMRCEGATRAGFVRRASAPSQRKANEVANRYEKSSGAFAPPREWRLKQAPGKWGHRRFPSFTETPRLFADAGVRREDTPRLFADTPVLFADPGIRREDTPRLFADAGVRGEDAEIRREETPRLFADPGIRREETPRLFADPGVRREETPRRVWPGGVRGEDTPFLLE
jgi:hypothetical protein